MSCELSCSVLSSIREACEGRGCWQSALKHCPDDQSALKHYDYDVQQIQGNCSTPLISGADWCCPTSTGKVVVLVMFCIAVLVGGVAALWYKGLIGKRVTSQTSTMNTPIINGGMPPANAGL
eukprot:COSAG01_NODE_15391_length_1343_cov_9.538585_2_plen_121_part_01